jgi:hypothetical protein
LVTQNAWHISFRRNSYWNDIYYQFGC